MLREGFAGLSAIVEHSMPAEWKVAYPRAYRDAGGWFSPKLPAMGFVGALWKRSRSVDAALRSGAEADAGYADCAYIAYARFRKGEVVIPFTEEVVVLSEDQFVVAMGSRSRGVPGIGMTRWSISRKAQVGHSLICRMWRGLWRGCLFWWIGRAKIMGLTPMSKSSQLGR